MRTLLWLFAVLLLLAAVAIVTFLLKGKPASTSVPQLSLSDFTNMAILIIAVVSLYVSVATYIDAKASAEQQQDALNASRKALESVVQTAVGQQTVLEQNLEVSKTQLDVVQRQWKQEQERLARRAQISILSLNDTPWATIEKAQVQTNLSITLKPEGWARLTFTVRNSGQASLGHPIYIFAVQPNTVFLDAVDFHLAERADHNRFQISGPQVLDLLPYSASHTDNAVSIDVIVPKTVTEFDFTFRILGENMDGAKDYNLHFKVVRPQ